MPPAVQDIKEYVVIVGADDAENVYGLMTRDDAFNYARTCDELFKAHLEEHRERAFPYGPPYATVHRVRNSTVSGPEEAAKNWVFDPNVFDGDSCVFPGCTGRFDAEVAASEPGATGWAFDPRESNSVPAHDHILWEDKS